MSTGGARRCRRATSNGAVVYGATIDGCGSQPDAVWAMDLSDEHRAVTAFSGWTSPVLGVSGLRPRYSFFIQMFRNSTFIGSPTCIWNPRRPLILRFFVSWSTSMLVM